MSDIFISYARSTAREAQAIAEALRALGYGVWRDDELPAHRDYSEVIEERLRSAKAVVVVWSAEAVKSQWVRAEADLAREACTLVQLSLDDAALPLPFNRIQCADLAGWTGDPDAPGWRKVVSSIADLAAGGAAIATPVYQPPPPLPDKPSIVVMPFANLSGDPEQDYFADGMVEEITAALSRFNSLFVIANSSAMSLKGKDVGASEAARQLGVRYVLEGSVRKAGGRVRIALKLIEAADGAQIWADRFEDTLEDVFALQDRVALSVAAVIVPTVQTAEIRRVSRRPTADMGSYDLHLRAMAIVTSSAGNVADLSTALQLIERAIALDPDFGPALAAAAYIRVIIGIHSSAGDREAHRSQAVELMQRALRVAGNDPAVLAGVATASIELGEDTASIAALIDRAFALNRGAAGLWGTSARLQLALGDGDLAAQHLETVMRLDPLSFNRFMYLSDLGAARLLQRRFGEAVALINQSIQLRGAVPRNYSLLAAALGHMGQLSAAREALGRFHALTPSTPQQLASRLFRTSEARKLFLDGIALAEGSSSRRSGTPRSKES